MTDWIQYVKYIDTNNILSIQRGEFQTPAGKSLDLRDWVVKVRCTLQQFNINPNPNHDDHEEKTPRQKANEMKKLRVWKRMYDNVSEDTVVVGCSLGLGSKYPSIHLLLLNILFLSLFICVRVFLGNLTLY